MPRNKSGKLPASVIEKIEHPPVYKCTRCGREFATPKGNFFMAKNSLLFKGNENYTHICTDCMNELLFDLKTKYKDAKIAIMILCHYLDVYFSEALYESLKDKTTFSFGEYMKCLAMKQYKGRSFSNTIIEMLKDEMRGSSALQEEREVKWNASDKRNKNFAISIVGYDPFESCGMKDSDRKYCFNILAGYCDSDGIQEDGHKIQSVIQITQSQLQCRKLDEIINAELLEVNPDENKIKNLTATKKQLTDSIAKTAQDNNLSSAYNKNSSKGANTLSLKMKEMAEDGYEQIKVNLFDVKTCGAIKQIADISTQSILDQLTLDSNDYTQMIKEQRELIEKLRKSSEEFEEENRMLKNKIVDMESKKKGK